MLFRYFSPIEYDGVPTADIFHHYKGYFDEAAAKFIKRRYQINGSPRPELLSYQLYGTVGYYWILLMLNDIYDPYYDWVMDEEAVQQYASIKYQNLEDKQHTIMYHVDENGKRYWRMTEYPDGSRNWYDIGDVNHRYVQHVGVLIPITAIEDEIAQNEHRRVIDIIMPSDIPAFIDALNRVMETAKNGT